MNKTIPINSDPSEQRHTTTRDENGGVVGVTDSGGRVEVVDDRKLTRIRPDGTTAKE
jgi:YD repeat-containing protein